MKLSGAVVYPMSEETAAAVTRTRLNWTAAIVRSVALPKHLLDLRTATRATPGRPERSMEQKSPDQCHTTYCLKKVYCLNCLRCRRHCVCPKKFR